MRTNRAARRLLGMPYTYSKGKSKINIFIAATADEDAEKIPQALKSKSRICVIQDDNKKTRTYHKIETHYPGYMAC
ncbi:stationary-phase-induced ribosome-associated protein [Morganella morganii]|uniref:stationary-phase-induced ribosome-associated protein n=1 Tax=Morganella morganii TaxID=582 RepID=UPI0034D799B4